MDNAVTDFPDPLSPTSATVCPRSTDTLTPLTAVVDWPSCPKETLRFSIFSNESTMTSVACEGFTRVQCIAHRLANEYQQAQHDGEHKKCREA